MPLTADNLLWQTPPGEGWALRPTRFEDSAEWQLPPGAIQPFSAGAMQGLALEAWVYMIVRQTGTVLLCSWGFANLGLKHAILSSYACTWLQRAVWL